VVYVGFDNPIPMGDKESGGHVSAPIWKAFMERTLKGYPKIDFPRPEDIVECKICKESGLLATPQCPVKYYQAFIEGKEPKIKCNFHSLDTDFMAPEKSGLDYENNTQPSNYPSFEEYQRLNGGGH
jgi:penicillin-binding protein 1A